MWISYQYLSVPVCLGWHAGLNIYGALRGGNSANTPLCPSHHPDQHAIGWADRTVGSLLCLAPLLTPPQSYFITCQFHPAGHCSISTWFSTTCAKSPTLTMRAACMPGPPEWERDRMIERRESAKLIERDWFNSQNLVYFCLLLHRNNGKHSIQLGRYWQCFLLESNKCMQGII